MFFMSSLAPDEIHIARPYIYSELEQKPTGHAFFDQRVDWISIHDDLPKFDSDSDNLANYRVIPSFRKDS